MTKEEATKVAGLMMEADGGCVVCARRLQQGLIRLFPRNDWQEILEDVWSGDYVSQTVVEERVAEIMEGV